MKSITIWRDLNVPYLLELAGLSEKRTLWQEHFHNLEIDDDGNKDEITPRYFWLKRGTTTSVNYVDTTDNNKVKQKMEGEQIENGSLVILDEGSKYLFGKKHFVRCKRPK